LVPPGGQLRLGFEKFKLGEEALPANHQNFAPILEPPLFVIEVFKVLIHMA